MSDGSEAGKATKESGAPEALGPPTFEDSHFVIFGPQDGTIFARTFGDWDNGEVQRLFDHLQPKIDGAAELPRFVMDLRQKNEITMTARYRTAQIMKGNRGKIYRTAVIVRDFRQEFTLNTLLRVSGRKNVRALLRLDDAIAFVRSGEPT